MKTLYKSQATVDTHPISSTSLHNCPTCRCKSIDHSMHLKHHNSQSYLFNNPSQQNNLYLSNHLSEVASVQKIGYRPSLSIIFNNGNRKELGRTTGVSPKMANISFSYTSPPKNQKHHSSQSRFNTKRFKEIHFPQINQDESDNITTKKVIKKKNEVSPYYEIYTGQKTPQKPRILKMRKQKSKQKLQITLSKNSSSQKSIDKNQQQVFIKNPFTHNEYEIQGPRHTPINALWENISEKTHKQLNSNDMQKYMNKQGTPPSIHFISQAENNNNKSKKSINIIQSQQSEYLHQTFQKSSNKKYPTVESIDTFQRTKNNEVMSQKYKKNNSQEGQTSLAYLQQKSNQQNSKKSMNSNSLSQIDLANSIAQQLNLNYDYQYPMDESDRSISIHVSL